MPPIDPTSHRPILPYGPGGLAGAHALPPTRPDGKEIKGSPSFAKVVELEAVRAKRAEAADPIPPEVRADMARAAELVDALAASGRRVAFDTHNLTGSLVASLVDEQGTTVRRLPLTDVVAGLRPDLLA
jgi:hypothetical protein